MLTDLWNWFSPIPTRWNVWLHNWWCLLPSLQSPSKNLPKQLASTCFFPWLPQLAQSQTWRQQAASVKKGQGESVSMKWCGTISPIYKSCSRMENSFTLSSLLFLFLPLSTLCWTFKAHPHSHSWSLYSSFPHFVGTFLGLPNFLVLFFYWTKTGNSFLIVPVLKHAYLSLCWATALYYIFYHGLMK